MNLFPPKWIFNSVKPWIDTSALASVPANVLNKSIGEIGISVFKKGGVFTCGIAIKFCDPGNLPCLK